MNQDQSQYLHISQLLSAEQLEQIHQLVERAQFRDGTTTASDAAASVKKNLQIRSEESLEAQQIANIVLQSISRNAMVHSAVMPKAILSPLISKYEENMTYGMHVDSPLMGSQYTIRTDVGMTLFLSDPDSYEGGELVVLTETGEKKFKLPAGDAILYPTTRLHQVLPITSGVRLAVITWMQSAVRDAHQRAVLHQLNSVISSMDFENESAQRLALQQVYSNLVRMWAEL